MRDLKEQYQILTELGRGGMGSVFLAKDRRLGRRVVLKLLSAAYPPISQDQERFLREVRAVLGIEHPNIASVHDVGEVESFYFIASEFIEGETLRQRINRGQPNIREAVRIATQVAHALEAAHSVGVVHRDIRPENILLSKRGFAKVTDFGVVGHMENPDLQTSVGSTTTQGVILGKVAYMSPEQIRGREIDGRTDLWSLGVVLSEMVSHRSPFQKGAALDTMGSILQDEPPPLAPNAPPELQEIVRKALQKSKEDRYQTAKDMAADLEHLQEDLRWFRTGGHVKSGDRSSIWTRLRRRLLKDKILVTRGATKREDKTAPDTLYINLWIEDENRKAVSLPATLKCGAAYAFLFAIEKWSREDSGVSEVFVEPPELAEAPVTRVVIELLCPFLPTEDQSGYVRREVDYRAGEGFPPVAFNLRPDTVGRFYLTARLLIRGETLYREVFDLEVIAGESVPAATDSFAVAALTD